MWDVVGSFAKKLLRKMIKFRCWVTKAIKMTSELFSLKCQCIIYFSDWDSATLSNESLLDTVSRFVLAALLKHTNLLSQACGESRQVT